MTLPDEVTKSDVDGTLVRELARQALLIAAEQELGLMTLDRSIGEVIPVGNVVSGPFVVTTVATRREPAKDAPKEAPPTYEFNVTITRSNLTGAAFQWNAPPFTLKGNNWIEPFVEHLEKLSRGPLVEALEKAGYEKSDISPNKAKISAKIEDRFDFVAQFGLVWGLHAQLRAGENPELLGKLVCAYANLGSLTDFHWSPASKAFKARALIYAQRLVSKYESTPFALAHRAYALALTGRHGAALRDVTAARNAEGTEAPDWLDLIAAYCEFDSVTLKKEDAPNPELALYLRLCATSMGYGMDNSGRIAEKLFKVSPACCRALDLIAESGGFTARRAVTEVSFDDIWLQVHYRLALLPNLPAPARLVANQVLRRPPDALAEYANRKELIDHLQSVTGVKDQPGPSWPALAELLRDLSYIQAWRVLDVQTNLLGIDSNPMLRAMGPVVEGHRMEKFLHVFTPDHPGTLSPLNGAVNSAGRDLFQAGALPLAEMLSLVGESETIRVRQIIRTNLDPIYEDALREMTGRIDHPHHRLSEISPHWPASIVDVIVRDPSPPLEQFEEKYGQSGIVLRAIASKHSLMSHPTDAIRCWKKVVEISKSCADHLRLAEVYRSSGEMKLWAATLEQALTRPDPGLHHAQIHIQLAEWFIGQKKWDEAGPHATKAAESFSGWGLKVGAKWAEGVEDWDQAATYMQNLSARYSDSAPQYFYWCLRTGHGNRSVARRIMEQQLNALPKPLHWIDQFPVAMGQIIEGERGAARKTLSEIFRACGNIPAGIYEALLADEDGDIERRDTLFREIENTATNKVSFRELVGCFRGVLDGTEDGRWNPNVMDMLVAKTSRYDAPLLFLLAGKFLGQHGQKERFQEFLQYAATSRAEIHFGTFLARDTLQKQSIPIGKTRPHFVPDAMHPLLELLDESVRASFVGDLPKATALLTDLLKQRGDFLPGLVARSYAYERQEKYAEAIADLEGAIRIDPRFHYAHIQLARVLSTCEKEEFRNGKKALQHAELAKLSQRDTAAGLAVLASAYAECGQFEKALELEARSRKLPNVDSLSDERLKLYSARKLYHAKPTAIEAWPSQPVWFVRD